MHSWFGRVNPLNQLEESEEAVVTIFADISDIVRSKVRIIQLFLRAESWKGRFNGTPMALNTLGEGTGRRIHKFYAMVNGFMIVALFGKTYVSLPTV